MKTQRKSKARAFGRFAEPGMRAKAARFFRNVFHLSNSRLLGRLARVSLTVWAAIKQSPPTGAHRAAASVIQPRNPLKNQRNLPAITIAIPFVEKDLQALRLVVPSVIKCVNNPIKEILLITPQDGESKRPALRNPESLSVLKGLLEEFDTCRLLYDADVLGDELGRVLQDGGSKRDAYSIQAILKFKVALGAATNATLVVDADTVLLEKKTWLSVEGVQLLQFSEEYHQPYRNLFSSFFGFTPSFPVSFVTHHQLLQKDIVRNLFPTDSVIKDWYLRSKTESDQKLSEYETYGHYLYKRCKGRYVFGNWSNLWSPHLEEVLSLLGADRLSSPAQLLPGYNSVSFHAHSQSNREAEKK